MATGTIKRHNWVYVGQATGNTILNIPATASEVSGYLIFGGNSNYGFPFFCVRNTDVAAYPNKLLFSYYNDTNDRHSVTVSIDWNANQIQLEAWHYIGVDFLSTSTIKLFYK